MHDLRAVAWLRWGRAGVTTGVAGALGLWAHVLAGGLLPRTGWVVAALGVLWVANAIMLGVPAGRLRLMALIGGGQFAFHVFLTAAAGHGGTHVSRAIDPVATSANTTVLTVRRGSLFDLTVGQSSYAAPSGAPHWTTHVVDDLTGPHALMALAHLMAAAAVGCWLAVGEQALWVLLALLGAAVLVLATRAVGPLLLASTSSGVALRNNRGVRSSRLSPRERACTAPLVRRGPPLSVA